MVVVFPDEVLFLVRDIMAGAVLGVASTSRISWSPELDSVGRFVVDTRDCRLWRFGVIWTVLLCGAGWIGCFGGAAAIGTTPGLPPVVLPAVILVGVVTADAEPAEPAADPGECELFSLRAFPELGVVAGVGCTEFFLELFFAPRVDVPPMLTAAPLPRLRFLITSVFRDNGLTTPCNLRNSPQALHKGCPSGFRLHSGVVCVKQLVHVVGTPLASCPFGPGLFGRDGARLENPEGAGEFTFDSVAPLFDNTGVDVVRGTLPRRRSSRWCMSDTEIAEP